MFKDKIIFEIKELDNVLDFFAISNNRLILIKEIYTDFKTDLTDIKTDEPLYVKYLTGFELEILDYKIGRVLTKKYIQLANLRYDIQGPHCSRINNNLEINFVYDTIHYSGGTSDTPYIDIYMISLETFELLSYETEEYFKYKQKLTEKENNINFQNENIIESILTKQNYYKQKDIIADFADEIIERKKLIINANKKPILAISFNNSKIVSLLNKSNFEYLYELTHPDNDHEKEYMGHLFYIETGIEKIEFSSDDNYIITRTKDRVLRVWELKEKNYLDNLLIETNIREKEQKKHNLSTIIPQNKETNIDKTHEKGIEKIGYKTVNILFIQKFNNFKLYLRNLKSDEILIISLITGSIVALLFGLLFFNTNYYKLVYGKSIEISKEMFFKSVYHDSFLLRKFNYLIAIISFLISFGITYLYLKRKNLEK